MKKRTGKMISLSLAVAMAMTAAPVTAMADEPVKTDVIEAPALTSADQTEETTTEEGTAWAELTPAEKTEEEEVLSDEGTAELSAQNNGAYVEHQVDEASAKENVFYVDETKENATLSDALKNAGTTESTIVLKNNVTGDFTIEEEQNITLDLNGYTITNTSNHTITNNGKLTIKDSSTENTGTVDNVSHGKATVWNNGTTTLEGGNFIRSQEAGIDANHNGGNSYYTLLNHGTMIVKDGVYVENKGKYSSLFENGWQNGNDNDSGKNSVLTIEGGTFSGGLNTIKNDDYGELTINGGSFTNMAQAAFLNWNVATVNGGTFEANEGSQAIILN